MYGLLSDWGDDSHKVSWVHDHSVSARTTSSTKTYAWTHAASRKQSGSLTRHFHQCLYSWCYLVWRGMIICFTWLSTLSKIKLYQIINGNPGFLMHESRLPCFRVYMLKFSQTRSRFGAQCNNRKPWHGAQLTSAWSPRIKRYRMAEQRRVPMRLQISL